MSTPLNDVFVPGQVKRSSDQSGAPDTRLRGRRLILARVAWVAAVTLLVAPFLAKHPAYYTFLQTICTGATCVPAQPTPDSAQAMQKLGLSVGTYAAFTLVLTLALAFLCWAVAGMVFLFFRDVSFALPVYDLVWHAALVLLLIAQVYRYRTAASPLQRQQAKWILFGGSVAVIIVVGLIVPLYLFPSLGQAGSFYQLIIAPVFIVTSLIFPLSLGLAILRFRLWDIDLIIRRTLVYSTLTVFLAVVYEVSIFTLQSITGGLGLIRGNQLAIIASTFLIGALFKPAHVSVWLCPHKRYLEETTRALPFIDTVGKP